MRPFDSIQMSLTVLCSVLAMVVTEYPRDRSSLVTVFCRAFHTSEKCPSAETLPAVTHGPLTIKEQEPDAVRVHFLMQLWVVFRAQL